MTIEEDELDYDTVLIMMKLSRINSENNQGSQDLSVGMHRLRERAATFACPQTLTLDVLKLLPEHARVERGEVASLGASGPWTPIPSTKGTYQAYQDVVQDCFSHAMRIYLRSKGVKMTDKKRWVPRTNTSCANRCVIAICFTPPGRYRQFEHGRP